MTHHATLRLIFAAITLLFESCRGVDAGTLPRTCDFETKVILEYQNPDTVLVPLSEFVKCFERVRLDQSKAKSYLESLDQFAEVYYVFTSIAVDALASDPRNNPLGIETYNGTQHGQVNIRDELQSLIDHVDKEGATVMMFLEINKIFGKLRDQHTIPQSLPPLFSGINGIAPSFGLVPSEVIHGNLTFTAADFKADSNGNLLMQQLVSQLDRVSGQVRLLETKNISLINGSTPFDYLNQLAQYPFGSFTNYKSIGPRFQDLMGRLFHNYKVQGEGYSLYLLSTPLMEIANPADFFQDEIQVYFTDGSNSTWHSMVELPVQVVNGSITIDELELLADLPGKGYAALTNALNTASITVRRQDAEVMDVKKEARRLDTSGDQFTMLLEDPAIAYMIVEDYMVLKVESFSADGIVKPEETMVSQVCAKIFSAAAEANIKKLIVDISNNGGGKVVFGYTLVQCLYPNATLADIGNSFQYLSSSALQYYQTVIGKVFETAFALPPSNFEQSAAYFSSNLTALSEALEITLNSLVGTVEFFAEYTPLQEISKYSNHVAAMRYYKQTIEDRRPMSISASEMFLIFQLLKPFQEIGPPAMIKDLYFPGIASPISDMVEINRGGILTNFTGTFYYMQPALLDKHRPILSKNPFESYVILSNGVSGSTAAQFYATAQLYSRSTPDAVQLSTVSYGGNGIQGDCPLAQFPGGSVNEGFELVGRDFGPLILLNALKPWLSPFNPTLESKIGHYQELLPQIPYYGDFPRFTSLQNYLVKMGSGSLPQEYLDIKPDYFIKDWYWSTKLDNPGDLLELYSEASRFFK